MSFNYGKALRMHGLVSKVMETYMLYESLCGPERKVWVHEILQERDRNSEFILAEQILYGEDSEKCLQYFRMDRAQFEYLLQLVEPLIVKQNTSWRQSISPKQRLILTLRYLATGSSHIQLSFSFRVGHTTIGVILRETLHALWTTLLPLVMPPPTESQWMRIAEEFSDIWQCPNCIGAIDGKHIKIRAPPNSGSEFFNYKGYFSIVLLAVCDAQYRFVLVDIGDSGRHSDGGVFSHSQFGQAFLSHQLHTPSPRPLPSTSIPFPFYFAGDDAFPLKVGLIKPYPCRFLTESQRIFNYRLCRARRVVENAFGILAARWQIYHRTINCDPGLSTLIVQASVVLHNFLMQPSTAGTSRPNIYGDKNGVNGTVANGNWRNSVPQNINLSSCGSLGSNFYSRTARQSRDMLKDFFLSHGAVPWQWDHY